MQEVYLIVQLVLVPVESPVWLTQAYEVEHTTRASCEKVLQVLDEHNLYDVNNLHCIKVIP